MRDTKQCIALIGYGVLIGAGAMIIWPFAPFGKTTKDWVDVAGAFGTCGATVVALWLGLDQLLRRKGDDMTRAKLVATRVSARLDWAEEKLQKAKDRIGRWDGADDLEPKQPFKDVWQCVSASRNAPPNTDDLVALAILGDVATSIARAYTAAERVDHDMHGWSLYFQNYRGYEADYAGGLLDDWRRGIDDALAHLHRARLGMAAHGVHW